MARNTIAVIGAGLAGLTAAYRIQQAGLKVDVYEARRRVGGRVFSAYMRNYLGEQVVIELGAQNITDGGKAAHLLQLTSEMGLKTDTQVVQLNLCVHADRAFHNYAQLMAASGDCIPRVSKHACAAKSIGVLIDDVFRDHSILACALKSRMTAYEGIDVYQQSIYHNLETLLYTLKGGIAKAHEQHTVANNTVAFSTIAGGNAKLTMALADTLGDAIHYHKVLNKIVLSDNQVQLFFDDSPSIKYDYVVLAVPVATYQQLDLSDAQISAEQLAKIQQVQAGSNYKVFAPLDMTHKNQHHALITKQMVAFSNHGSTVPVLYLHQATHNVPELIDITCKGLGYQRPTDQIQIETAIDQNFKDYQSGVSHYWADDPYARGSYVSYTKNCAAVLDKYQMHAGTQYKILFRPIQQRLFFAGEHTTILDCIGTMEAAVESGDRIGSAIIAITALNKKN